MKKILSIMFICVIVLSACSSQEKDSIAGTITVVVPFNDGASQFASVVEGFKDKYPEVDDVVFEGTESDYDSYITTRLTGDNYGDLFVVPFDLTATPDQYQNYLLSQGSTDEVSSKYAFSDQASYEEETYALPLSLNVLGLAYNSDVTSSAGISEYPSSTEEILEACKQVGIKTESKCWYSNLNSIPQLFNGALTSYGSENYQEQIIDSNTLVDEGQAHRLLFDFIYQMIENEYTETDIMAGDVGTSFNEIATGKSTFIVAGSQMLPAIKAQSDNPEVIKLAPFPITSGGTQSIAVGPDSLIGVSSNTKNSATAQAFLEYLISPESNYAESTYGISPQINDGEIKMPENLEYLSEFPIIRTIGTSSQEVNVMYNDISAGADMARIEEPIGELVSSTLNGEDYDKFLTDIEDRWESSINEQ